MQVINKEEMDIVDLDGDLQRWRFKEEKSWELWRQYESTLLLLQDMTKEENNQMLGNLLLGKMSLHLQHNSVFYILSNSHNLGLCKRCKFILSTLKKMILLKWSFVNIILNTKNKNLFLWVSRNNCFLNQLLLCNNSGNSNI